MSAHNSCVNVGRDVVVADIDAVADGDKPGVTVGVLVDDVVNAGDRVCVPVAVELRDCVLVAVALAARTAAGAASSSARIARGCVLEGRRGAGGWV